MFNSTSPNMLMQELSNTDPRNPNKPIYDALVTAIYSRMISTEAVQQDLEGFVCDMVKKNIGSIIQKEQYKESIKSKEKVKNNTPPNDDESGGN